MGNHNHSHNHVHAVKSKGNKTGLLCALIITFGIMLAEAVGGYLTNSLALISDAGHMLSDTCSLFMSLLAVWVAAKPASGSKSYGYRRFEILVAMFNGVTLFAVAGYIIFEAYHRLLTPPVIDSSAMMLIAFIGLLANIASAWVLLKKGDANNVNLRSAYLHVLGDALGSVGAIVAGILMQVYAWYIADPIISVLVSLVILRSAWTVVDQSVHILMEGVPSGVELSEVTDALGKIEGVLNVHDVHIWTVTSGYEVFSCHLLAEKGINAARMLSQAVSLIETQFGIKHVTIQIEEEGTCLSHFGCCGNDCAFEK